MGGGGGGELLTVDPRSLHGLLAKKKPRRADSCERLRLSRLIFVGEDPGGSDYNNVGGGYHTGHCSPACLGPPCPWGRGSILHGVLAVSGRATCRRTPSRGSRGSGPHSGPFLAIPVIAAARQIEQSGCLASTGCLTGRPQPRKMCVDIGVPLA